MAAKTGAGQKGGKREHKGGGRKNQKHPGVSVYKTKATQKGKRFRWRAKWKDETAAGGLKYEDISHLTTIEAREAWAINKAAELAQERETFARHGRAPGAGGRLD